MSLANLEELMVYLFAVILFVILILMETLVILPVKNYSTFVAFKDTQSKTMHFKFLFS